jgi:hypothetical protein
MGPSLASTSKSPLLTPMNASASREDPWACAAISRRSVASTVALRLAGGVAGADVEASLVALGVFLSSFMLGLVIG